MRDKTTAEVYTNAPLSQYGLQQGNRPRRASHKERATEPKRTDTPRPTPSAGRTVAEAGWHASRYNIGAIIPGSDNTAVVNLFRGTCCECTPLEGFLLSALDELDEHHPIIERFARRGIICNFDERAAIEALGRAACAAPHEVNLTICPTMACNFACPYCFQEHGFDQGKTSGGGQTCSAVMPADVQDGVVALAARMLETSRAKQLRVMWFGGEPLLAPAVIESLSARLKDVAAAQGASYHAKITTNGYLLDQHMADLLARASVESATVTLDGVGSLHDETRHLANGGGTFDRIAENLRNPKLPFSVAIRHNVHAGNIDRAAELEEFVAQLARETGNDLVYDQALVIGNPVADARGVDVGELDGVQALSVGVRQEAQRFEPTRGRYCNALSAFSVTIDSQGRLYKCWEAAGKPEHAFGRAHDWDPEEPLSTAAGCDNFTRYLNMAAPVPDPECRECLWLPLCLGGCPMKRFQGRRACVPFKDDPASFALAVHARMKRES